MKRAGLLLERLCACGWSRGRFPGLPAALGSLRESADLLCPAALYSRTVGEGPSPVPLPELRCCWGDAGHRRAWWYHSQLAGHGLLRASVTCGFAGRATPDRPACPLHTWRLRDLSVWKEPLRGQSLSIPSPALVVRLGPGLVAGAEGR